MSSPKFAIQYEYSGTVSGEDGQQHPVGTVFARHWRGDIWTYTKDKHAATLFDSAEEASRSASRFWRNARIVEVAERKAEVADE